MWITGESARVVRFDAADVPEKQRLTIFHNVGLSGD
jgi:hypothetical protein